MQRARNLSRRMRAATAMLAAVSLASLGGGVRAQRVVEAHWGFDGRVVPGQFNPLTLVVENDTNAPVETQLTLWRSNGLSQMGGTLVEPCFLTPGSRRVVQFFPLVLRHTELWELQFRGARLQRESVPGLRLGHGAVAVLRSTSGVRAARGTIPEFPAAWFPATSGGAQTLREAVLDHAPTWDPPRQRAFLHWLRAGGRLHLMRRGGAFPEFEGILTPLNLPLQRFAVGSGTVIRYDRSAAGLVPAMLSLHTDTTTLEEIEDINRRRAEENSAYSLATPILQSLRGLVPVRHSWPLIFAVAVVFLLLVGPVHWRLARRGLDYRISIAGLLTCVALFTWLLMVIGARGHGERSRVLTLAVATPMGDGEHAVTQYTQVFATDGALYTLSESGDGALLSTAQEQEAVNALIDNGRAGAMRVDIPMFSFRSLVRRASLPGPDFSLEVLDADDETAEQAAGPARVSRLRAVGALPSVTKAWLIEAGGVRNLYRDGNELVAEGVSFPLQHFVGEDRVLRASHHFAGSDDDSVSERLQALAQQHAITLLAERFGLLRPSAFRALVERPSALCVLLAPAPESFALRAEPELEPEEGYVLYLIELHTDH